MTARSRSVGPAYEWVASRLRAMILAGEVVPGDRLPVEAELAEQFAVSRSTVREALRALASENLVSTTRGVAGGTFVNHPRTDAISGSLATGLDFMTIAADLTAHDLLEARQFLELPAARLAAERRTPEQLEVLALALADDDDVDRRHRFEGNKAFHEALMEATGNRVITILAGPLFGVLRDRFLRDSPPRSFWHEVMLDHHRIYDAVAAFDSNGAVEAMAAHFERMRGAYTVGAWRAP